MSTIQPSQGRIVLYHITKSKTTPAVITDVYSDGSVNLDLFGMGSYTSKSLVVASPNGDPNPAGRYSWPQRVGPGV